MTPELFVGRTRELETLRTAFDEALEGHGSAVVLAGEPGIGKTRTVEELGGYAESRGAHVLWGRAQESAGAPAYWPWLQIGNAWGAAVDLTGAGSTRLRGTTADLTELSRLFPTLQGEANPDTPERPHDPQASQFRLLEAFTRFMRDASLSAPWVVVLEDLQWTDKPSLQLLAHVARDLAQMRVLIVGTYRDAGLSRTHPLTDALVELNRGGRLSRITLGGLSREDTGIYLREHSKIVPSQALVERLWQTTEGNPFFLGEMMQVLIENGAIDEGDSAEVRLPAGVREALGRHLSHLSDETNSLLEYAAVAGRQFAYDTLKDVSGHDDAMMLRLLEEGVRARVIEDAERPGRYRFTHALMQETLLAELSATRRGQMHGAVGEAVERRYGDAASSQAPRLAYHFNESAALNETHRLRALQYALEAGRQAEAVSAWDEAARWYQVAVTLIDESQAVVVREDVGALLTVLGRCARDAGEPRVAWRALMRAIDGYRERDDGLGQARAASEAMQVYAPRSRLMLIAGEALKALDGADPRLEASLSAALANIEDEVGTDPTAALEHRARALELASQHGFDDVEGLLASGDGLRAYYSSQLSRSATAHQQSHNLLHKAAAFGAAANAAVLTGWTLLGRGSIDEGTRAANAALVYARDRGIQTQEEIATALVGSTFLVRADFASFVGLAAIRSKAESAHYLPGLLATSSEMQGDIEGAVGLLPDPALAGGVSYAITQVHSLRARVLWNAGRSTDAQRDYNAAVEITQANALNWRAPDGTRVSPELIGAVDEALTPLADETFLRACVMFGRYTFSEAAEVFWFDPASSRGVARALAAIALFLGEIDDAESWFIAALAWSAREHCPIEAGRCHEGLAEVAVRRGDIAAAMQHLDIAQSLFLEHGAKLYLDRLETKRATFEPTRLYPDSLSEREVEVLRRVATGRSNQQIADDLVIAPATVARHISNILNKTGLANRTEAATYAMRHSLLE